MLYIFKLTPNKKDVIINTDVLLNGYPAVEYPIPFKDLTLLGYVQDPDTFKFVDNDTFEDISKPYPVSIELIANFKNLPFYGVNKQCSTDKIIYKGFKQSINGNKLLMPSDDGTYDTGIFQPTEEGYNNNSCYYASYTILVNVYWSDGKSHSNEVNWNVGGNNVSNPLTFTIKALPLKGESTEYRYPSTVNEIIRLPDNFSMSEIDAVKFQIAVTFFDPNTFMSVYTYKEVIVKQEPYIGLRTGYVNVDFVDTEPLEIFSLDSSIYYAKSIDEQANIKVDKNLYTEYYMFTVPPLTLNINVDNYKNHILPYDGVLPYSESINDLKNIPIDDIGKFTLNGVKVNHFCVNSYSESLIASPGFFTKLDTNVFNNSSDYDTFWKRFSDCYLESSDYYLLTPINDDVDISPNGNTNKSIIDKFPEIIINEELVAYHAKYAYFVIIDNKYYQVQNYTAIDSSISYFSDGNLHDIIDYKNSEIEIKSVTGKKPVEYIVISDKNNNSVQYKFCVNNLLEPYGDEFSVQSPRFAAYPIMRGCLPILFITYNFEDINDIPFITVSDTSAIMHNKDTGKIEIEPDILKENILNKNNNNNSNPEELEPYFPDTLTDNKYVITGFVDSLTSNIEENKTYNAIGKKKVTYGVSNSPSYRLVLNNVSDSVKDYLRVNGIKYNDLDNGTMLSEVNPGIFVISIDEYPYELSEVINVDLYDIKKNKVAILNKLLITNDENEKHLINYDNKGDAINTIHHSSMLLRANPKLSGNIKLVVDTDYNLYLDTFKANSILNDHKYRKYPISTDGNYPRDVKTVFNSMPSNNLFAVPEDSLNAHKVYTDFNDLYETMYEYGAEINKDNLYSENMKILAPLHIGNDVPEFFAIFRMKDDIYNKETYNGGSIKDIIKFKSLIENAEIIKTYDLRTYTSIGQYLNNYQKMLTNYGQCYLLFIEQDYDQNSDAYRLGNNIWKGISVKRGILTDLSETTYFGSKILNDKTSVNKQETFNNYIIAGFERHNLLYPNIINLEFMFNDNDMDEYSMHRYFGLYLTANDFIEYGYIISEQNVANKVIFNRYARWYKIYKFLQSKISPRRLNLLRLLMLKNNDLSNIDISDYSLNILYRNVINRKPPMPLPYANNNVLKKYDINGEQYIGDSNIYSKIFTKNYKDRIFYAIINDHAERIHSEKELNTFLNTYVKNQPEKNITALTSDRIEFNNTDKSFITLHFSKPISYGEHIKLIAMNYNSSISTYTNVGDSENNSSNKISVEHVVYELIGSNDERLRYTDNNISPYINTHKCRYSENTYFVRISFYTQDVNYPNITATIELLIKRIIACINKFNSFFYISSYNKNSIAIISSHDEMYLQHIQRKDFDDFKYDYLKWQSITDTMYTTNEDYTASIDFLPCKDIEYVNNYTLAIDEENDWLSEATLGEWISYVEAEDPDNIIEDSISYFNKDFKYKMHALTNQTDYFDSYYVSFSNYCFETTGWRYNNVVEFVKIKDIRNSYTIYDDIQSLIKDIKYPLVYNTKDSYETINIFNINNGYLRNNLLDLDNYLSYTFEKQELIFDIAELPLVTSPFNVDFAMIASTNDILLINNLIHIYKPKSVCVSIMGISNIKDIDTTIDLDRNIHIETNLIINISAGSTIKTDESDYRIQYGVMYQLEEGELLLLNTTNKISQGSKFVFIPGTLYIENGANYNNIQYITAKTDVKIKIVDRLKYQEYNYDTSIPTLYSDNYFKNPKDTVNSELVYPIVPLTHCLWKSNGLYYDQNNVLDVSTLTFDYETVGNFVENIYTVSDFSTNQYVTNKINNILYVNDKPISFKDCILNNRILHPIKKLLIDNVNIETASAYYNSAIQSLEFIFSGIKFNIKLNSKVVNSFIHLEDYSGYEVFVLNDFDITKVNEIYISLIEKFILLINHLFYIDYAHEGVSNIKILNTLNYQGYADYAAFAAPYSINFATTTTLSNKVVSYKKDGYLHKSLMNVIDEHNLWSSMFIQYDIPTFITNSEKVNEPLFILSMLETTSEYDNYVTFGKYKEDILGLLYDKSVMNVNGLTYDIGNYSISSISNPYIITKADGDYNHSAYILLKQINDKVLRFILQSAPNITNIYGATIEAINEISISRPLLTNTRKLTLNESNLLKRFDIKTTPVKELSSIMNSIDFQVSYLPLQQLTKLRTYRIPLVYLKPLRRYIEKIIALESPKEKLERYVKTFDNNIDIYVIPENSDVKTVKNRTDYNPLIFTLSVPNEIKFNYGWFTPKTNNIIDFYIDDELRDILNIDLLLSNTKIKDIYPLYNYTGNKVYEDSKLSKLHYNYFLVSERSLLSSTWDTLYYRLYSDENNYINKEGHITGIDDKSFFGSKCMVLHNEYLLLDTWVYSTANDIYTTFERDSENNTNTNNERCLLIDINLTNAVFNHFINNKVFANNWNAFKNSAYTGMKNYINNTIYSFYNMNSNIDVELYAIDTEENANINIIDIKPVNISSYYIYENYSTKIELKDNMYILTIIINKTAGMNIYPNVKIYRK